MASPRRFLDSLCPESAVLWMYAVLELANGVNLSPIQPEWPPQTVLIVTR